MSDIENNKEKEQLINKKKKYVEKEITEEEKKEYLKNSILIPKDQWEKLPVNSFISYVKNDNKFIKGGFIKLFFKKKDIDYLIYSSKLDKYNNDRYYKEFTINLNNIKEIYKKVDTSAIIEYQIIKKDITASLSKFVTEIEKINNKLEELDIKINKAEENNKKTIKLIKNLHNIKSLDDIKK